MSKKVMISFVAGVGMLALTGAGQAQNTPSTPGKADAPMGSKSDAPMNSKSSAAKKATGEVTSVDAKTGKLMVKTSTEELNLDVQASAAKKSLSSIKVGDKVNVSYHDKSGTLVANSVRKASANSKTGTGSSSMGSGSSSSGSSSKDNMGSSSTGSGSSSTGSSSGTGSSTKSR